MGSDFDSLQADLVLATETMRRMVEGAGATLNLVTQVRDRHDAELAEIRDDLVALANRVERLTQALTVHPADVAARMVDRGY